MAFSNRLRDPALFRDSRTTELLKELDEASQASRELKERIAQAQEKERAPTLRLVVSHRRRTA